MATQMARGLESIEGARIMQPVQANEIFVEMPEKRIAALERAGFHFYRWPLGSVDRRGRHPLGDHLCHDRG